MPTYIAKGHCYSKWWKDTCDEIRVAASPEDLMTKDFRMRGDMAVLGDLEWKVAINQLGNFGVMREVQYDHSQTPFRVTYYANGNCDKVYEDIMASLKRRY